MKEAVLLLNMGGPNNLDEVEVFLKNMFADPFILTTKSDLMRKIIGSIIVKSRLNKSKDIYRQINNKSPMVEITYSLTQKLQQRDPSKIYTYAMRYTPPFAAPVLADLKQKGVEKLHLFSMYPHYSSTTTMSSFKDIYDGLKSLDYSPEIQLTERYFDNKAYLQIIANDIKKALNGNYANNFTLIFSAHSLPKSIIDAGDPYQNEVQKNVALLTDLLKEQGMEFQEIILSYQSKVGPTKWLEPSTQKIISQSIGKNIIIYPLGFTIDNSETIYEINQQYKDVAEKSGALSFTPCPCLNDKEEFVDMILDLTR
ncbi:MAG: ferrochelatase [Helicobacter sp.]|nr:ferrochelatase [Helicobacter sp.]